MQRFTWFLLLVLCCFCIGCSSPVKNTEQKTPYTRGAGSTCKVTLNNEETTKHLFYLDGGQSLKMDASDVKVVIRLQVTDAEGSVIFENDNVYADMEGESYFGIQAPQEGNYTLEIEIAETGGYAVSCAGIKQHAVSPASTAGSTRLAVSPLKHVYLTKIQFATKYFRAMSRRR